MNQNVTVCGRNINANVIETELVSAKEYRRSLINILKGVVLYDGDLDKLRKMYGMPLTLFRRQNPRRKEERMETKKKIELLETMLAANEAARKAIIRNTNDPLYYFAESITLINRLKIEGLLSKLKKENIIEINNNGNNNHHNK